MGNRFSRRGWLGAILGIVFARWVGGGSGDIPTKSRLPSKKSDYVMKHGPPSERFTILTWSQGRIIEWRVGTAAEFAAWEAGSQRSG